MKLTMQKLLSDSGRARQKVAIEILNPVMTNLSNTWKSEMKQEVVK
jgi:hypothetical protein